MHVYEFDYKCLCGATFLMMVNIVNVSDSISSDSNPLNANYYTCYNMLKDRASLLSVVSTRSTCSIFSFFLSKGPNNQWK